jgi:drug/metabolite transporter (DMT)-like permease
VSRATLLQIGGIALIVVGVASVVWGLTHLREPPMRGSRLPYATSRQLQSISGGVGAIFFGVVVFRHGRAYKGL